MQESLNVVELWNPPDAAEMPDGSNEELKWESGRHTGK